MLVAPLSWSLRARATGYRGVPAWARLRTGGSALAGSGVRLLCDAAPTCQSAGSRASDASPGEPPAVSPRERRSSGDEREVFVVVGVGALGEVYLELALDALEGVVDRLHVAVELVADLLVAVAVGVEGEHVDLEVREHLGQAVLHRTEALGGDQPVGGVVALAVDWTSSSTARSPGLVTGAGCRRSTRTG